MTSVCVCLSVCPSASTLIKFVATRCQILRLKCTKFDFGTKISKFQHPFDFPAGEAYSAPPDPITGFKGPTSRGGKGRGGEGEGKGGRERKGEERGGMEREGTPKGWFTPQSSKF